MRADILFVCSDGRISILIKINCDQVSVHGHPSQICQLMSNLMFAKLLLIFLIRLNSPYLSVKIKARPSKQDVNKQKRFAFKLSDIDNAKLL